MPPTRSLLIGSTQRAGTTMLCRGLADTGVAGRPEEYFLAADPAQFPTWGFWEAGPFGLAHGARDAAHYLEIVAELGTTPNGVFGAKLMWNNVPWAVERFRRVARFAGLDAPAVFAAAFPDLRPVLLTRRDRVRQAVSWSRAAQDGVWEVRADAPVRPESEASYDRELIANLERLIVEGEQGWRDLVAELGLTALHVVYEDMVADWAGTVRAVLVHLDLDDRVDVPEPRTIRRADETNEAWVKRFRSDDG